MRSALCDIADFLEEANMPRRERDREIARRRHRKAKRKKLRAKGLLPPAPGMEAAKIVEKKRPKKPVAKEVPPPEAAKKEEPPKEAEAKAESPKEEPPKEEAPKADNG
jgi:hypothetical protein